MSHLKVTLVYVMVLQGLSHAPAYMHVLTRNSLACSTDIAVLN